VNRRTRIRPTRDDVAAPETVASPTPPAEAVLSLQRAHGNRAVTQMLARNGRGPGTVPQVKPAADRFQDALKASDWSTAAVTLDELPDKDIQALLKPLSNAQLTGLENAAKLLPVLMWWLDDRVHRNVVFRLNPGPATVPAHPDRAPIKSPGDEKYAGKAGGGKVSVHTDVELTAPDGSGSKEWFSLGYEGKDAGKTRWLQFIWREMEVHPKTGTTFCLDDTIEAAGGAQYKLTKNRKQPNWNTDAAKNAASPFYEDSGVNNRTADATTMFDHPGSGVALVVTQFDAPVEATKVISRAHFATYLVRDMEILEKIEIDVEWEFTSKTAPPRTYHVAAKGPVGALDPAQKERLEAQFPKFAYLP
jgi:hypothetical protein